MIFFQNFSYLATYVYAKGNTQRETGVMTIGQICKVDLPYSDNNNNNNNKNIHPYICTHAVETSGAWCSQSARFVEDIGRRITAVTNAIETTYLYQRLSVSLQRGNALAFNNTFPETYFFPPQWLILFGNKISNLTIVKPAGFVLAGEK